MSFVKFAIGRNRGQTTMEFLILVGFMLFVFTAFFMVVQERSAVMKQELYVRELEGTSKLFEEEIVLAHQVRYGYSREFEMPNYIGGEPYVLHIYNGTEFTIKRTNTDEEYVVFLPTTVLVGSGSCYRTYGDITPGEKYVIKKLPSVSGLGYLNNSLGLYNSSYGAPATLTFCP